MKEHMFVKGKTLSAWSKRQIKEKVRRLCRSEGVELLVFVSETN